MRLRYWLIICLLNISTLTMGQSVHYLNLINSGKTGYCIYLDRHCSDMDMKAATLLQTTLRNISNITIPIVRTIPPLQKQIIYLVSPKSTAELPVVIDFKKLEVDGFSIKTKDDAVVIAGGSGKGTLYAVQTFLDHYLGVKKYSPSDEHIPKNPVVVIPEINLTEIPVVKYRDINLKDDNFNDWLRLDRYSDRWGMYVHTFFKLVPPEKYFAAHPEYYSLLPAGRVKDAQLCLSNPEVLKIVIDELGKRMAEHPEYKYWSVSQNDTYSPCGCDQCKALDQKYGGPSGTMIWFVNQVAAAFPEKQISTLAYQYTRSAPKNIVPAPNVNIFLCSIECNRSKPIETDPSSVSFVKDVKDWAKLTKNIHLWDYTIQYRNFLNPFPNLWVLQPNIQFFVKNGITSIFEQGMSSMGGDMTELRSYLVAHLLWNPNQDFDSLLKDFLYPYYGKAAPHIRIYLKSMQEALKASGEELGIYGFPIPRNNSYLSAGNMEKYDIVLEKAEAAVQDEPEFLNRVRKTRLPMMFARLEQAKIYATGPRGFFFLDKDSIYRPKPGMLALLDTFYLRCKRYNIGMLNESGLSPEDYVAATKDYLNKSMKKNLALFQPVILAAPASPKYHDGDAASLTDGITGLDDYHLNWLGFEGEDMVATVDLGREKPIKELRINFMQDINSWIFEPQYVMFESSKDGRKFDHVATVDNNLPEDRAGFISWPFISSPANLSARYIRITAGNMKTCPKWHKGAGGKSWIFADEIYIN